MILIVRCYPFPIFLLKRKVPEKIHELSIQRQDTVGDILIDNLKPDVFKNGFLKAFCNKIVEHTARFLGKRNITMCKVT